ncbi:hypothetical protein [Secundilactobacillus folii]|uniref:Uncharacterized protein n=1 Tax=Secundilactobacillus folii TaxID=2678357 RepID=A0A7X2XV09_9LACO|nr:hypothetical protein [Secundilactobacillus folii]MTV82192.1 hypothetical protein [Secundilactobacillus folii]
MLYLLDVTPSYYQKLSQQRYLDITDIQPDDVRTAQDDPRWLPDFNQVLTMINVAESRSDYRTILVMKGQRIMKC